MKKVKLTAWILAAALFTGTALAGCGTAQEEETEPVEAAPVSVEEEEIEEALQEIGDPTASLEILLTNEMGSAITALSIKSSLEADYPANMMAADQKIANDETVKLFYTPVTTDAAESEESEAVQPDESFVGDWDCSWNADFKLSILTVSDDAVEFYLQGSGEAKSSEQVTATPDSDNSIYSFNDNDFTGEIIFYANAVSVEITQIGSTTFEPGTIVFDERDAIYTLQVTMENGDVYEFTGFDVKDMAEVTLYLEDGVAYLEYMSLSQNVLISTKETEQQIKADKDAAQTVIDMIAAIGEVTADNAEEHRSEIEAARAAYDALTDAQKSYVTNYTLLEEMEAALNETNSSESNESAQESSESESSGAENAYDAGYELGRAGYSEDASEVTSAADYWKARGDEMGYTAGITEFWEGYYAGHSDYKDEEYAELNASDSSQEDYDEFYEDYYTGDLGDINRERANKAAENGEDLDVGHWEGDVWVQNY
ncbi:MAG: hypothetical protein LIO56_02735 [Lachnospiraceae bacterium]|nr:hypothetical protein [Lachnospiraceae bacterium]